MAKYKLTSDGVQDTETGVFIPNNLKNRDWCKYQDWLSKPNNKPDLEFTEEELTAQKQSKIKGIERTIVDTRVRKDAAKAEGFTELEAESQAELDELRAELAAEQDAQGDEQ